jgi:Ca-activated chloride channel family protein
MFTNVPVLRGVAPRGAWRRHLAAGALLAMLTVLVVAAARPAHAAQVVNDRGVVVVAVDTSSSMEARDVKPSRLAAARVEAARFVRSLPSSLQVGVVGFTSNPVLEAQPGTARSAVLSRIQGLQAGEGTAIGDSIVVSLAAIRSASGDAGNHTPGAIVIVSDGESNAGTAPDRAALQAARAGVPVSTIAIGTRRGTVDVLGTKFDVPVQDRELATVAQRTHGRHYTAASERGLRVAYESLSGNLAYHSSTSDLTTWFLAAATVLGLLLAVASLVWLARLP